MCLVSESMNNFCQGYLLVNIIKLASFKTRNGSNLFIASQDFKIISRNERVRKIFSRFDNFTETFLGSRTINVDHGVTVWCRLHVLH